MKLSQISIMIVVLAVLTACAPVSPTDGDETPSMPTATTEKPILMWTRSGGIAGFCDEVVVYELGWADVVNCKGNIRTRIQLTEGQRVQLDGWRQIYSPIDYEQSNPGVADAMTVSLYFAGEGSQKADEEIIYAISQFAGDIAAQVMFNRNAPQEKDEAAQTLGEYLSALNRKDFILGAKLYGGSIELLQIWNPDISDDIPALLERACTQNGLVCLEPLSIDYRGVDQSGNYLFRVEFSNPDGSLFTQGPCCGEEEGQAVTSFIFRVIQTESGFAVLDLPPYVP